MRETDEGVTEDVTHGSVAVKLIFDLHIDHQCALIIILKSCLCIFLMFIKSLVNVYFFLIV